MFTSPALVATIVPTATISSGAAVVSVRPHAPGERRLPSIRAENTFSHDPPVAATSSAQSTSATAIETTYVATVTTASRTGRRGGPPGMTGAASTTASGSSSISLTPPLRP